MGSSGFTSRNKSHISTGGGRELRGGKDEGLKKKKMGEVEMQRCVLAGGGRERENGEREGLKKRDKGAKKGWEIRKVEVIYTPTLLSHTGHL